MGRGVGEGGRVMAGQGQTKPCALAREESGMEGREVGGGGGGGGWVMGVVRLRHIDLIENITVMLILL